MASAPVPPFQTFAVQTPRDINGGEQSFPKAIYSGTAPVGTVGTVAALGSSLATGATLPLTPIVAVTAADATKGVVLPVCPVGTQIIVHNVANAVLKVYPQSGGDINDGTPSAAISMAAKTQGRFVNIDNVTWSAAYV